jgi:membrane-associated PAP2 superfamily phosphatase
MSILWAVARWRVRRLMQAFRQTLRRDLIFTFVALGLLVAWDASGFDLLLARPWANAQGFPLRDNWFLAKVLHEGARRAAWLPALWLIIGVWKPTGVLRRLSQSLRVQWAGTTLLALAAISLLKHFSHTSCPWDLAEFGGRASWISHWAFGVTDGGPGRCFPAGHASAAFAFLSGYFALRSVAPAQARAWLIGALLMGLVLGGAQQLRGAHFMSHTLWTGLLCWVVALVVDTSVRAFGRRSPAPGVAEAPLNSAN